MVKGEEKNLTIENLLFRTKFEEEDSFKMIKAAGFDGVDFCFHKEGGKALDFSGHTEKAKRRCEIHTAFAFCTSIQL